MNNSRLITILLIIFLIGDLTFSFIQYYNTPLYGDLAGGILPDKNVQSTFSDPLGFHVLITGETHSNPNRFFSHYFLSKYFQHVPFLLQNFADPINSVFLSSAIARLVIQLLFVYLLTFFIGQTPNPAKKNFLIVAVIIAPLFQVYGYWSRMGIIDKSIVYTFFYALPLVVLMVFFLPFFNLLMYNKKIKPVHYLYMIPLVVILPLSGPLIPAVVLIVSFLIFLNLFIQSEKRNPVTFLKSVPNSFYILLIPINLGSLYSLFLGFYNSNYSGEMISLAERFSRLPEGIFSQLFHSLGFPLLLLMIGVNVFLMKRNHVPGSENLIRILKWIGIFTVIYILLLPFGGYRPYRPRIIRYDTIMPVTIGLIYFFSASSYFLLNHLNKKVKKNYATGLIFVLLVFIVADFEGFGENSCERMALKKMADSKEKIIELPKDCFVLSWENKFDYTQTEKEAELIYFWKITNEKKLYYNKQ